MLLAFFLKFLQFALALSAVILLLVPTQLCIGRYQFVRIIHVICLSENASMTQEQNFSSPEFNSTPNPFLATFNHSIGYSTSIYDADGTTNSTDFKIHSQSDTSIKENEQGQTTDRYSTEMTQTPITPPSRLDPVTEWSCMSIGLNQRFCATPNLNPYSDKFCIGLGLMILPLFAYSLALIVFIVQLVLIFRDEYNDDTLCRRCVLFATVMLVLGADSLFAFIHWRWNKSQIPAPLPTTCYVGHLIGWVIFATLLVEGCFSDTLYGCCFELERIAGSYSPAETRPPKIRWGWYRRMPESERGQELKVIKIHRSKNVSRAPDGEK